MATNHNVGKLVEFVRSSFCDTATCVEVGQSPVTQYVYMRNSQDPGTVIFFTAEEWRAFIAGVKNGEFDVNESI